MLFGIFGERRNVENPSVSLSGRTAFAELFGTTAMSSSGEHVTEATALGVPAIWQAINLISGTIGHLPFHLYRDSKGSAEKATNDPLYSVIHDRANSTTTKYVFWKWIVSRMVSRGRGYARILKNGTGKVVGFLPLDESTVTVRQTITNGEIRRVYNVAGKDFDYMDILDLPLTLAADGITHRDPIALNKQAIGLMIGAERYAANLFANGGVPSLVMSGPIGSPAASDRADEQINGALKEGSPGNGNKKIIKLPTGFDLKDIGFDPSKQQLIELRRFEISEASRIFNVPPSMLHDLTSGTFNNVEQQNLNFTQHTILPIVKTIEQELNLKLFGLRNTKNFVEINLDGLVRGDFKSRMEGLARGINSAIYTPNEARALMNLPATDDGDSLLIQGATIPLSKAGETPVQPVPEPEAEPETETDTDTPKDGEEEK